VSSPRSWGCFLLIPFQWQPAPRLPHARGGVSSDRCNPLLLIWSSPRSWGCFQASH